MDELEILVEQERAFREAKKQDPWLRDDILQDISWRKARLAFYQSKRDQLIALCGERTCSRGGYSGVTAGQMWSELENNTRSTDSQSLMTFRSLLIANKLLVDEARAEALKMDFQFRDPEQQKRVREAQRFSQDYNIAIREILALVARPKRQDALAIYNRSDIGGRDDRRLENWVRDLVGAKLLPPEYYSGRKLGGAINKLLQPLRDFRAHDPRSEVK